MIWATRHILWNGLSMTEKKQMGGVKKIMIKNKKQYREIALKLMLEQLENTSYSLEREEYENFSMEEIEAVSYEIYKVCEQFKKRYNIQ